MKETLQVDLREFYITPFYLETMTGRARFWSLPFIEQQLELFNQTIPDYPEVMEILEKELYTRRLNGLKNLLKKKSRGQIELLKLKYENEPDFQEVIQAELEIRSGAQRLTDSSGET